MSQCPPCSQNCDQGRQCSARQRQHYTPEPRRSTERVRGALLAVAIGALLASVMVYH